MGQQAAAMVLLTVALSWCLLFSFDLSATGDFSIQISIFSLFRCVVDCGHVTYVTINVLYLRIFTDITLIQRVPVFVNFLHLTLHVAPLY